MTETPHLYNNKEFGAFGEEMACRYLTQAHYRLLERNWRYGHEEIDIVAEWFGEIIFIEVKTRRNETVQKAAEAVDHAKQQHLLHAARAFMRLYQLDRPMRFDVITVVGTPADYRVEHLKDAFSYETFSRDAQGRRQHLPR